MPNKTSQALCAQLGGKVHDVLKDLSQGQNQHALLDFPNHWNIGDSAIWLGEADVLQRLHGRAPDYVSHLRYPLDQIERSLPQDGLIYLHGGGNFGDIWPRHQNYREAVIARFAHRRVIQLPQSLHYSDPAAVESTKRVIAAHHDFHLLVRDRKSLAFAEREFDCNVQLVPDSAFGIDMRRFKRDPAPQGVGCIFRVDKEKRDDAETGHALFADEGPEDWSHEGKRADLWEKAMMGVFMTVPQRLTGGMGPAAFTGVAKSRVALGFRQIDRHAVLVTDRLHGHIMATLLGKPHVVIDNFYGKITNFIDAWGADDVTLRAKDFDEARAMADQLLEQTG